jgi:crossover junction endodeoxyribonuclease RusA
VGKLPAPLLWSQDHLLPFEFVVIGTPISLQAKNRERLQAWKNSVRRAAEKFWSISPTQELVELTVVYYYDMTTALDVDNIIKPIQDALIGLVYTDDRQVTDVISRKRDLNGSFRIRGMSRILAEGFCVGEEFLYIKVDIAPDLKDLAP